MSKVDTGLLFENYKSFGDGLTGFESLAPTNVIIGRNNSGKSALLDLVEWICQPADFPRHLCHAGNAPRVVLQTTLTEHQVASVFQKNTSRGPFHGNYWEAAKGLVGARIDVAIPGKGAHSLVKLYGEVAKGSIVPGQDITPYYANLAGSSDNPFKGHIFRRLSAERDIVPETTSASLQVGKNGAGLTNTIAEILNRFDHPTNLVSQKMLAELNEIFAPDAIFDSITVQQYGNGAWEVFLTERAKGTIALSHSGSGLKTVLLVIGFFLLVPYIQKAPLSSFIFAHP
jgi:putative ATP-dependent endonuclease of OLD family